MVLTLRIDLRGLGGPIKQIKELLLEGWSRIRHRHADDFRSNTKALLEGLHVVDALASNKHLDPESKSRIRHRLVESMLNLFKASALPREVQPVEIIFNDTLIEGIQRRLLPTRSIPIVAAPAEEPVTVEFEEMPVEKQSSGTAPKAIRRPKGSRSRAFERNRIDNRRSFPRSQGALGNRIVPGSCTATAAALLG